MGWQNNKRFWDSVSVRPEGVGFGIYLDGRPLRTPQKSALILPTQALAAEVAAEWQAQKDQIKPETMPFTRMANSAIDKVAQQKTQVGELLAAYGDSDLLCYRAESPAELVLRQCAAWDPVLEWADDALDVRLLPRNGVVHIAQSDTDNARLLARVHALSNFELAGFHDLVSLTGSLVLAFATTSGFRTPKEVWGLSRVDEDWQVEQWGEDQESKRLELTKRESFFHAENFFRLTRIKP